jgi:hypothetical protein
MDKLTQNLLRHFAEATEAEREAGRVWYRNARREARALAKAHNVTVRRAAGVLAALSPNVKWADNVVGARSIFEGYGKLAGYSSNAAKARRIAAGEAPSAVLRGPKVTRFYRAILGDQDVAVVDMWMFRAMGLEPGGCTYAEGERAIMAAAAHVGEPTAVFQAIVWTKVRGGAK